MKNIFKVIIIFGCLIISGCSLKQNKEYTMNLYYMDTYIYVEFSCDDYDLAEEIQESVKNIYEDYHILSDRYQSYEDVFNIYDIYHNSDNASSITLDPKLYNLLKYASYYQDITSNLFNIEIGGIIDVWKKYREDDFGIPSDKEIKNADKRVELVLLDDNKIKNNHPNLDLGAISKGYATQKVGEYFKEKGISNYLINAGGNVLVGEKSNSQKYKVGIQHPDKDGSLLTVVNCNNKSVVTSGGYERNYIYDGVLYSHIIDPNTKYPATYMKSVTVISDDSALGDILSTTLFLMSIEDGKEFIKDYDVEVIWVSNDNEIIRSEGFSSYE